MKKFTVLLILLVCTLCMYGQGEIEMRGVEVINPNVLNQIIAKHKKSIRLRSSDVFETRAINVFHQDIDTGVELTKESNGRVIVYRVVNGVESASGRPALTPFSLGYNEGSYVTKVEEKTVPDGYKPYSVLLVIYFNENLDMTLIEANGPFRHNNTDKKYLTIYLLTERI